MVLNLSDVTGTVSDNIFHNDDIGVLVANGTGPLDITGNTFEDMLAWRRTPAAATRLASCSISSAPFSNTINVSGNTFSDDDAGIRTSAVPGTTVANSTITIDDNSFSNVATRLSAGRRHAALHQFDGRTASVAERVLRRLRRATVNETTGNDVIVGGGGTDTVVYAGTLTREHHRERDFHRRQRQQPAGRSRPDQGTDTLSGIEKVTTARTTSCWSPAPTPPSRRRSTRPRPATRSLSGLVLSPARRRSARS